MIDVIASLDTTNISAVPSVQDWLEGRKHWRIILREREPDAAVLVARPQPAVAYKPAQCEAQLAGPLRRKPEHRHFPIFANADIRRREGKFRILRETSFSRLNQQ